MLSKKQKIFIQPFVDEKYKRHRNKVRSAQAAIDFGRPADQPHVLIKLKKIQKEHERMREIEKENQRLLQKLSQIMSVNRLENYWRQPHPTFLHRVFIRTPKPDRRAQSIATKEANKTSDLNQSNACKCSRRRPQTNPVKIPEERIPFEPPRKTRNHKLLNESPDVHRCCTFCC